MSHKNLPTASLADDTIWGVSGKQGIAAEIGRTPQQTYYLIAQGALPVRKLGHKTIVASRKQLRRLTGNDSSETA
jgi:hypothetical protein